MNAELIGPCNFAACLRWNAVILPAQRERERRVARLDAGGTERWRVSILVSESGRRLAWLPGFELMAARFFHW